MNEFSLNKLNFDLQGLFVQKQESKEKKRINGHVFKEIVEKLNSKSQIISSFATSINKNKPTTKKTFNKNIFLINFLKNSSFLEKIKKCFSSIFHPFSDFKTEDLLKKNTRFLTDKLTAFKKNKNQEIKNRANVISFFINQISNETQPEKINYIADQLKSEIKELHDLFNSSQTTHEGAAIDCLKQSLLNPDFKQACLKNESLNDLRKQLLNDVSTEDIIGNSTIEADLAEHWEQLPQFEDSQIDRLLSAFNRVDSDARLLLGARISRSISNLETKAQLHPQDQKRLNALKNKQLQLQKQIKKENFEQILDEMKKNPQKIANMNRDEVKSLELKGFSYYLMSLAQNKNSDKPVSSILNQWMDKNAQFLKGEKEVKQKELQKNIAAFWSDKAGKEMADVGSNQYFTAAYLTSAISKYLTTDHCSLDKTEVETIQKEILMPLNEVVTSDYIGGLRSADRNVDLYNRLSDLQPGQRIVYPTGCQGHATLLLIERDRSNPDVTRVTHYNTGFGLKHGRHEAIDDKSFQTFKSYLIPTDNLKKLESCQKIASATDKAKDMRALYGFLEKSATTIEAARTERVYFERRQESGSCSAQCQMAFLRHQLMQIAEKKGLTPQQQLTFYKKIKAELFLSQVDQMMKIEKDNPVVLEKLQNKKIKMQAYL